MLRLFRLLNPVFTVALATGALSSSLGTDFISEAAVGLELWQPGQS